ncbi:protein translocase subunit SecD [Candidatus Nomurabacteria bacterium]|nr:protein translocase subunit SecD [Candidatus Kaiserbacteria bacterium]MCB9815139.1 protein translocase subunit SecD [Candidatus Nomurabacteria bacterium]
MSKLESQQSDQSQAFLRWFRVIVVVVLIAWLGNSIYQNSISPEATKPFKLGLDLAGGSHLVYVADTKGVDQSEIPELMNVLRDVIERRVNVFGVSEPIVQVEHSSFVTDNPTERLVVELPGVTDVSEAVAEIGRTPLLEFKLFSQELADQQSALESLNSLTKSSSSSEVVIGNVKINGEEVTIGEDELPFVDTGLTGRYLQTANLEFAGANSGRLSNEPMVTVTFTPEGADLFGEITKAHVGEQLGIFLDGELLSSPVINEPITGGTAVISGNFDLEEARSLYKNLSFGALPLPIELQSTQTIGASLGFEVLDHGIKAGFLGLSLVMLFMVLWYRLPGLIAGVALLSYITIMLSLFLFIPVTLTAAGLAGFILSLGMAVDANVLVFERMKEEFRSGAGSRKSAEVGFSRAWSAIRDGNITSLLSAIILFWFGTSMVKGFALVFGIGIIASMFSALVITRTFLIALPDVNKSSNGLMSKLLGSGLNFNRSKQE